jgi:hypothetical protein
LKFEHIKQAVIRKMIKMDLKAVGLGERVHGLD